MSEPLMIDVVLYDFSAELAQGVSCWVQTQSHQDDQSQLAAHPQRKLIQQLSRYVRRQHMAMRLQVSKSSLVFSSTAHGKPQLAAYPHCGFNQSHSQSMYALASSLQCANIGVDVEDKHRQIQLEPLAKRCLTCAEYLIFEQVAAANRHVFWLKMWTIKEAVLKAAGLGIRLNLNELDTQLLRFDQSRGVLEHPLIGRWHYACVELEQHVLSVSWAAQCGGVDHMQIVLSEWAHIQPDD